MNKLYEEASIQDIADAIREKTGGTDTYTVAQMGDAIRGISSSDFETIKVYEGTIDQTINGSGQYAVLAKDDVLAEHRNHSALFVRVEFDIVPTPYTIVKVWGITTPRSTLPVDMAAYQYIQRYGADGSYSHATNTTSINEYNPQGVGYMHITEDGELRVYSNSSNFAIRPSNYRVIVECCSAINRLQNVMRLEGGIAE